MPRRASLLRLFFPPPPVPPARAPYGLDVDGIAATVQRKPIRGLRMRLVPPAGALHVSAPLRASERSIRSFITERRDWILKHQQRMAADALRQAGAERALAQLSPPERRARERQERRRLLADAQALLPRWEAALGVHAGGLAIRSMRSRWGSCNTRTGKITLSLALAQQAPGILEAIVVHELAHLRVPHHGPAFKALMDEHLPDWRLRKKKMRESSPGLFSEGIEHA